MNTLFISDTHFGHSNCIAFDDRPFSCVEEMDMEMIHRWNRKVNKDDQVYVLGDFCYRNRTSVDDYVSQLHGTIHLIRGNHDKRSEAYERCFAEVCDYKDLSVMLHHAVPCRLILCHYFIPFYAGSGRMAFMLHGHTHKKREHEVEERFKADLRAMGIRCEAYNVGAMHQDYEPQTLEEIIARQGREIQSF